MDTTVKVRKGNVILHINESQVESYLSRGFDVIGENGVIVKKCVPNDVQTLRAEYVRLTERVKELENQTPVDQSSEIVAELQAKNEKLESTVADLKKQVKKLKDQLKEAGK